MGYVQDERYFAIEHMDVRREASQVCSHVKFQVYPLRPRDALEACLRRKVPVSRRVIGTDLKESAFSEFAGS